MYGLTELLQQLPAYQDIINDAMAAAETGPQSLLSSARAYVMAGLKRHRSGPILFITGSSDTAKQMAMALESWLPAVEDGGPRVLLFADPDALPYERINWTGHTRQQRLTALAALQSRASNQPKPLVVVSARALMQKTLPARELRLALRPLKVGSIVRLDQMITNWVQTGYTPADVVEEPGTFARRGGIVDVWPPNLPHPIRLDLFGDEIDSLRLFDPATQRSLSQLKEVEIGPGSEALSKYGASALERLGIQGERLNDLSNLTIGSEGESPLQDPSLVLAIREELRLEVEHLVEGRSFHGIEWYLPYFYAEAASILDYVTSETLVVVDDGIDLSATLTELEGKAKGLHEELTRVGELPEAYASSAFTVDEIREKLAALNPLILGFGDIYGKASSANTPLARSFVPGPRYGGKVKQIANDSVKHHQDGHRLVMATRQAARIESLLQDEDLMVHTQDPSQLTYAPKTSSITLLQHVMTEGFTVRGLAGSGPASESSFYLMTDTELFGWSKPQTRRRQKTQSTVAPEIFFADVKEGEHVVHLEHGIGTYDGLVKLEIGGIEREYLQVSYARGDKLYVPVHQADRLSRYVGAGESSPPVTRLGTADWKAVKEKAKKSVADIADDLLKLYAERELTQGYVYSPDGPWQDELEASFPYQETGDQLRAIEEVKDDMESDQPMDRLVCGDVGYGKTEVAVRAAFKAIMDGQQVAVLVPTTVLALQHYRTFSERLRSFPVKVEMLSRFRTPAQQRQISNELSEGSIDLVVGTHRILSNDLQFKSLSLLIIDEEQRFGVVQKEKLKQLRAEIDVLTLSATPIPRTLHMSMSGIRDMSTINTPPRERLPVKTVLSEFDDIMVRQAIQRELDRNGQIFVVHNRVRGIKALADRIERLVPDAIVATGHGQMGERELEDVMMRFSEGEVDILVATTIIENGLDIPNANTIIINRANHFGLAQLYQLRGRVGRSASRGHCYLLYDKHTTLSFDARRRLEAIMESSEELGAGFRIAMRDLEIRGAGDLLGARQSGQIDSVGFDLYTRLLAQSINEAKKRKDRFEEELKKQAQANQQASAKSSESDKPEKESSAQATPAPTDEKPEPPSPFDLSDPLAPPVTMDLPLDAQIPEYYIEDASLRLQLYRRIAGATQFEEIDTMRQELIDRFGTHPDTKSVPVEVENLFYQIRVKILALRAKVSGIGRELDQLVLRSEMLDKADSRLIQRRLQIGLGRMVDDEFVPVDRIRASKKGVYLPLDEAGYWQKTLTGALEILAFS